MAYPPPPYGNPPGGSAPPPMVGPYGVPSAPPTAAAAAAAHAAHSLQSKLRLRLSCKEVVKLDRLSKSDPFVQVLLNSAATGGNWVEVGRTETIVNASDPVFATPVEVDFLFEEKQCLLFRVYDADGKSADISKHDFVGEVITTVGDVVGCSHGHFSHELRLPASTAKRGILHVSSEEISKHDGTVAMSWSATGLDKKDFGPWGKSDPYLEIVTVLGQGKDAVVHRTEVIKKTLNPIWKPLSLKLSAMCNCDYDRPIELRVYDWDSDGSHDFIGSAKTTMGELSQQQRTVFELINPKKLPGGKKAKKGYQNSGVLKLNSMSVTEHPSFVGLLSAGLELNFAVAVDFTSSNGLPHLPNSLHYMNPHAPNEYIRAMQAVGGVLEDYDSDKQFPALGYGALVHGTPSHCFSLAGALDQSCHGIAGIVQAYQGTIANPAVKLHGPTYFAPVIRHVAGLAREKHFHRQGKEYFVLMILTDGIITDMGATIDAIVEASPLPMSIIIVGVGGADFSAMERLDGDDARLTSSSGVAAARDIVQFVPFREFQRTPGILAKEVLHELPEQVVEYTMKFVQGAHPH